MAIDLSSETFNKSGMLPLRCASTSERTNPDPRSHARPASPVDGRVLRCHPGGERATLDAVPSVHRAGPYRFFFYSADRHEPPHIHVERDSNRAKFWLDPIRLANSGGFPAAELRQIERLVTELAEHLLRAWHEHFTD